MQPFVLIDGALVSFSICHQKLLLSRGAPTWIRQTLVHERGDRIHVRLTAVKIKVSWSKAVSAFMPGNARYWKKS